jgi:hypothetical protein
MTAGPISRLTRQRFGDACARLSAALAAEKAAAGNALALAIRSILLGDGSAESTDRCCDEIDRAIARTRSTAQGGTR